MKQTVRWILALLGPVLLGILVYGSYSIGACLYYAKIAEKLRTEVNEHGFTVKTLNSLAPLLENLQGGRPFRTALKFAELGELVERGEIDECRRRFENKRFTAQLRLDAGELQALEQLFSTTTDQSVLLEELKRRTILILVPRIGEREEQVCEFVRDALPSSSSFLPLLKDHIRH